MKTREKASVFLEFQKTTEENKGRVSGGKKFQSKIVLFWLINVDFNKNT